MWKNIIKAVEEVGRGDMEEYERRMLSSENENDYDDRPPQLTFAEHRKQRGLINNLFDDMTYDLESEGGIDALYYDIAHWLSESKEELTISSVKEIARKVISSFKKAHIADLKEMQRKLLEEYKTKE